MTGKGDWIPGTNDEAYRANYPTIDWNAREREVAEQSVPCPIPWGSTDMRGNWYPNRLLKMNADEQYRQNVANGFIKETP